MIKGAGHGENHDKAGLEYENRLTAFFLKHL